MVPDSALDGFVRVRQARTTALLRSEHADELRALGVLDPDTFFARCTPTEHLGRERPLGLELGSGGSALVRRNRRAGLARFMTAGSYLLAARALREAAVSEAARSAGVATPEVLAAVDVTRLGVVHSGFIVTRRIEGAVPLRVRLSKPGGEGVLIEDVAKALRRLHDGGIAHPDLTVENILAANGNEVWVIDLDGCTHSPRLTVRRRLGDLLRFRRSARKNGLALKAPDWGRFFDSYAGSDARLIARREVWLRSFDRRLVFYRLGWKLGI